MRNDRSAFGVGDTYVLTRADEDIGAFGANGTFALWQDPGDEVIEIALVLTQVADPDRLLNQTLEALDRIGDDATALATAQAALEIPAPIVPGDIDHNDLASRTAADAHPASAITNTPAGGIAATTVQAAIDELDTEKQPLDATLTALAGVTTAADKVIYATGSDTFATTDLTAAARTVLDDASTSAMRTTLGLAIGTDVQAYDAELAAIAGLTSAADKVPYFTGSGTAALADFTSTGRQITERTSIAAARELIGVYRIWEDFLFPPANSTQVASGTGTTYQQNQTLAAWLYTSNLAGLFAAEVGAGGSASDGACRVSTNAGTLYLYDGAEFIFHIGCSGVSNAIFRWGLRSDSPASGTADVTNGIYFEINTTTGSDVLGCTAAASSRTKTSTGYANSNVSQLFKWFRIRFVDGTTGAVFGHWDSGTSAWVDDLTIATNLPTAGTNRGARWFVQAAYNGTTSRKIVIDAFATCPVQGGNASAFPVID